MSTTQKTRYSIDMDDEHREKLATLAKRYKITQGEAIEVMLDFVEHADQIAPAMMARREAKLAARKEAKAAREPAKALAKELLTLSPEQLAAALETARRLQAAGGAA